MDKAVLENLLKQIQGCSFATLDAETIESPGIIHSVTGTRVLMFTNKNCSGYENIVKRRLAAAGKNPDNFVLGELPWGTRIPDTPLIEHKGKTYLQVVLLSQGVSKYLLNGKEYTAEQLQIKPKRHFNQGLAPSEEVQVRCYDLASITRISLLGERLVTNGRSILRINA